MTCWVVGDLVWDAYAYLRWERPAVSFADVLYLAGYPLLALGIVRILVLRTPGRYREGLLDGVAFAIAAAIATWAFLVVPTTAEASLLDAAVWGAYPFADVLLLAAVAWLVLTPGRRSTPTLLLMFFLSTTLILDLLWTALPLINEGFDLGVLNAGYPVAYAALALAAIVRNSGELTAATSLPEGRMHPARFMLLGFALMTAPTVAIATTTSMSLQSELFLFVASMTLASIVLWRFRIAVRERERVQAELQHQLAHDHLTGLYNRRQWIEGLQLQLLRAGRTGRRVAVLYIDLDDFKPVNDTWGHAAGDDVLSTVAQRLKWLVRPHDVVARVGGDEFAISCEDLTGPADAEEIAVRIIDGLSQPVADRRRARLGVGEHRNRDERRRRRKRNAWSTKPTRPGRIIDGLSQPVAIADELVSVSTSIGIEMSNGHIGSGTHRGRTERPCTGRSRPAAIATRCTAIRSGRRRPLRRHAAG